MTKLADILVDIRDAFGGCGVGGLQRLLLLIDSRQVESKLRQKYPRRKFYFWETFSKLVLFVGPLPRVRPRNGILALLLLLLLVPLRSEFIGEL